LTPQRQLLRCFSITRTGSRPQPCEVQRIESPRRTNHRRRFLATTTRAATATTAGTTDIAFLCCLYGPPQATCTHVRLSALVGGNDALVEDSANELVSVLQVHFLVRSRQVVAPPQTNVSVCLFTGCVGARDPSPSARAGVVGALGLLGSVSGAAGLKTARTWGCLTQSVDAGGASSIWLRFVSRPPAKAIPCSFRTQHTPGARATLHHMPTCNLQCPSRDFRLDRFRWIERKRRAGPKSLAAYFSRC